MEELKADSIQDSSLEIQEEPCFDSDSQDWKLVQWAVYW
jgi:hypothetical protein